MKMEFVFILVEPAVPENIGAAARAMKTMGFNRLRLVRPADHLGSGALKLAHGAHEILEQAELFPVLQDSVKDLDYVVGTTTKKRNIRNEYIDAKLLSSFLEGKGHTIRRVGLIFGREESGLTNEEIALCDVLSTVPLKTTYPSLNLSQAVMIYTYLLSGLSFEVNEQPDQEISEFNVLKRKLTEFLPQIGIRTKHPIYVRILERVALMKQDDIHLALSIIEKINKM